MIISPGELYEDTVVYVGAREVEAAIFVFAAFFVDTSPLGYRILGATVQGKQKSIQSAEIMVSYFRQAHIHFLPYDLLG